MEALHERANDAEMSTPIIDSIKLLLEMVPLKLRMPLLSVAYTEAWKSQSSRVTDFTTILLPSIASSLLLLKSMERAIWQFLIESWPIFS